MSSSLNSLLKALSTSQRESLCRKVQKERLLAYITLKEGNETLDSRIFKKHLEQSLPDYMVPAQIIIIPEIPHLPNGKLNRSKLTSFSVPSPDATSSPAQTPISQTNTAINLKAIWEEVLSCEVEMEDNFFELGGDSIMSIQIISRARSEGMMITPVDLADYPTLVELAQKVDTNQEAQEDNGSNITQTQISPIQHWFFDLDLVAPEYWDQSAMICFKQGISREAIEKAIIKLVETNTQLGTGYQKSEGNWKSCIKDGSTEILDKIPDGSCFSLNGSPLVRWTILDEGASLRLHIRAHHLVMDSVSWFVLLEQLDLLCRDFNEGRSVSALPSLPTYGDWVNKLNQLSFESEIPYWRAPSTDLNGRLSCDYKIQGDLVEADTNKHTVILGRELSEKLYKDANQAYNTTTDDLLLTALARQLRQWCEANHFRIGTEHHGRDTSLVDMDISQTIGWFTSYYPLRLVITSEEIDVGIKQIKELVHSVPNSALGYGALRYGSNPDTKALVASDDDTEDVLFNHLGSVNIQQSNSRTIESFETMNSGMRHLENKRSHLLEINAYRKDGAFTMDWIFNGKAHRLETIENWANSYLTDLSKIIEHCCSTGQVQYTPSDFPEADMDQTDLDEFLKDL